MGKIEIAISIAVGVASIVNAVTKHWTSVGGGRWARLAKTVLWLIEMISVTRSRDTTSLNPLKMPLSDGGGSASGRKRDGLGGGAACLLILAVFASASCAGDTLRRSISASVSAVSAAQVAIDGMCEPVLTSCIARDRRTTDACPELLRCHSAQRSAVEALDVASRISYAAILAIESGDRPSAARLAAEAHAGIVRLGSIILGRGGQ